MPTPIFVLGKQRSGTTALANHLCAHSAIGGVQHERHRGIHESGYYPYLVGRYGSLDRWTNFREFVEVAHASDYFRLTGISKEYMLSLYPTSYAAFFQSVMDAFAQRSGVQYWLEKTPEHTRYALRLADAYPTAKFVAILRDAEAVLASSLGAAPDRSCRSNRERLYTVFRLALGWVYYTKCIEALRRTVPDRTLVVRYDDLRHHKSALLTRVCTFLDLDYEKNMTTTPYAPNTSFPEGASRDRALTDTERSAIPVLLALFRRVPYDAYRLLDVIADRLRSPLPFPDWFFALSDADADT